MTENKEIKSNVVGEEPGALNPTVTVAKIERVEDDVADQVVDAYPVPADEVMPDAGIDDPDYVAPSAIADEIANDEAKTQREQDDWRRDDRLHLSDVIGKFAKLDTNEERLAFFQSDIPELEADQEALATVYPYETSHALALFAKLFAEQAKFVKLGGYTYVESGDLAVPVRTSVTHTETLKLLGLPNNDDRDAFSVQVSYALFSDVLHVKVLTEGDRFKNKLAALRDSVIGTDANDAVTRDTIKMYRYVSKALSASDFDLSLIRDTVVHDYNNGDVERFGEIVAALGQENVIAADTKPVEKRKWFGGSADNSAQESAKAQVPDFGKLLAMARSDMHLNTAKTLAMIDAKIADVQHQVNAESVPDMSDVVRMLEHTVMDNLNNNFVQKLNQILGVMSAKLNFNIKHVEDVNVADMFVVEHDVESAE